MNLVQAIREGRAQVEWATLKAHHEEFTLELAVMRDAMKIDGVRQPATAIDMQLVADELGAMLPTPKVLDLIWLEAGKTGLQFDPIINHRYSGKTVIVANMPVEDVSELVDEKIAGKDNGGIIASVGKYWVLTNALLHGKYGSSQACNYGWHSSSAPYLGVTQGLKVWQPIGSVHNSVHIDPSQVVRLMHREAWLSSGEVRKLVDLHEVATVEKLAPLISHEGVLHILRQPGLPGPPRVA